MSSSNVTLFAKWTTIIYTVTFNSNGGSSVPSQGCLYLDTVSKPTDPTKTGNTFAGWFEDAGCTDPWYFNRDRVTQNMTLFAKWTSNQYTVVFDSQGGSHVSPETVTHGNKAVRPANPTKTGYTFTGWFKDQKCTESWVFESDRVNSNVVLYAGWTVTYHTVTFNVNGGSAVTPQSIRYGAKASMPARPTKGNYALAGWYRDVALTNQWTFTTTAVTADVTLYAKWATYTLGSRGPAGGWVFYDAGSYSGGTWRYLEAAPSDYSNTIPWGAEELTLAGGYDLGRGNDNTSTIIDKFGNSYLYGARVCRELVVGDYSDWSLPSADELDYMRERLYLEGKGGFLNAYYWSSTEDNQLRAYAFMFSGSAPGGKKLNKNLPYRVRAIRYF
jgi:uncharacterized repeat protein (TIGR02543 family)